MPAKKEKEPRMGLEINEFNTEKGRKQADLDVEYALYKTACNGNASAQIFYLTNRLVTEYAKNPEPGRADPMECVRALAESNRLAAEAVLSPGKAQT